MPAVRDDPGAVIANQEFSVPGHPVTTVVFIAACWLVVVNTVYAYPANTGIGLAIVVAGIPAYFFWRWWRATRSC